MCIRDRHKPEWLSVDALESVLAAEKQATRLQSLPFHYMEVAQIVLRSFRDDFAGSDKLRTLLGDIENIRTDRIHVGIDDLAKVTVNSKRMNSIALRNASAMELIVMKKFVLGSLKIFGAFFGTDLSDVQQTSKTEPGTGTTGRKLRRYR